MPTPISIAKAKGQTPVQNQSGIDQMVAEYDALRARKKAIEDRIKVLATSIKDYATVNGSKDDKGSYLAENANFTFGSQCKKSIKLVDEKVLKYFKEHKLDDYIETKEFVDEKAVEALSSDGTIPYEDLEAMCETKITYSVMVVKKEEVTAEVEEHAVMPVAASKKPKLKVPNRK